MRGTRVFQSAIVGTFVLAGLLTGLTPASAAHATAAGVASAGSAGVVRNGNTVTVAPVGQCSLTGKKNGSSAGATKNGIVSYGSATSTCATDATAHTSNSTATGSAFTLSALTSYGGPTIKVASYQVTCSATTSGTNASWQFSGLTGVTIPKQVPTDYTIPIKAANGKLLADVIMNEVILPSPNDGSITMNLIHIKLFPNGVPKNTKPMSGDVYVGSTACSPTA
jgi:hypothetical protein